MQFPDTKTEAKYRKMTEVHPRLWGWLSWLDTYCVAAFGFEVAITALAWGKASISAAKMNHDRQVHIKDQFDSFFNALTADYCAIRGKIISFRVGHPELIEGTDTDE